MRRTCTVCAPPEGHASAAALARGLALSLGMAVVPAGVVGDGSARGHGRNAPPRGIRRRVWGGLICAAWR